jgi:hypothetical protein
MKSILKRLFFPVIGLLSLIWFLIRVIPKPSRATYPCMKATAPLALSFVIYVFGLVSSLFIFKRAKKYLYESKYILFSISLFAGLIFGISTYLQTDKKVYAGSQKSTIEGPNQPMGNGVGIHPGRVVWIHNPDATDENCTNSDGDYWWQDDNTNQSVVNAMLSDALQMLTGESSDAAAWNAIFHYYNQTHGSGDVGYTTGEKIVIKINLNSSFVFGLETIDTSPHITYAILNQLINVAGIPQANIGIGDPGRNFYWDNCLDDFPNVNYWGYNKAIVRSDNFEMYTSDGVIKDYLPKCYLEADYMINIPVLKKHHRAGISLSSKNHFGTFVPFNDGSVYNWHYSLPCSEFGAVVDNGEYGSYRCFVDIMGHKDIGGKTIIYLVDGIWSSTNYAHPPIKWAMTPFNNDWPSSIFLSQDPVAIESVGFDFLYEEFDEDHPTEGPINPDDDEKGAFPYFAGTDDFLHQAADQSNWPDNITYDPENDDTPIASSLGTHEHWNNAIDKKYTRNLGGSTGIELVSNYNPVPIIEQNDDANLAVNDFTLHQNYPNPFNATTTIWYSLSKPAHISLIIYNELGQNIRTIINEFENSGNHVQRWNGLTDHGVEAASGVYFYEIIAKNGEQVFKQMKKMVYNK